MDCYNCCSLERTCCRSTRVPAEMTSQVAAGSIPGIGVQFWRLTKPPVVSLIVFTAVIGMLRDDARLGEAPELHTYRSEEHTSELQSHSDLACRLLLDTKKHADP